MTTQKDLNKDMVALLSSIHDRIQELRSEVVALRSDMDSQHMRNNNFNDRLINLEENKMKTIDEELKRIDTLEQAFNREF
jgi:predicted nuclease with TOPRIM domain